MGRRKIFAVKNKDGIWIQAKSTEKGAVDCRIYKGGSIHPVKQLGRQPIINNKKEQREYDLRIKEKIKVQEQKDKEEIEYKKNLSQQIKPVNAPVESIKAVLIRTEEQEKYNLQTKQLKYKSAEELEVAINDYFDKVALVHTKANSVDKSNNKAIYTMSGLAYHLGFKSREGFVNYGKKEEFADIISVARLRVEIYLETRLHQRNPVGAIFGLKNHGWSDNVKSNLHITFNPFLELMKKSGV